jgi:hypothetical protein
MESDVLTPGPILFHKASVHFNGRIEIPFNMRVEIGVL